MKVWLIVLILLTASCSSTKHTRKKYQPADTTQPVRVKEKKVNGVVQFHILLLLFFGLIEHFNKED